MGMNYVYKAGWFVGLVLLQVLVLNNIHIAGCATPFLYIYLLGLAVDIFSDTLGMNAAAVVLLAFLRPLFLRLFLPRDVQDSLVPSLQTMGTASFFKYAVACVLVHHTMLFALEFFSLAHIGLLLLRMVTSMALTLACVMAVEGIVKK